jgi:hypothetical protein
MKLKTRSYYGHAPDNPLKLLPNVYVHVQEYLYSVKLKKNSFSLIVPGGDYWDCLICMNDVDKVIGNYALHLRTAERRIAGLRTST